MIDGDCGRGFTKINELCVNVSYEAAAQTDIATKCSELGTNVSPLVTTSASFLFQLRVSLSTAIDTLAISLIK